MAEAALALDQADLGATVDAIAAVQEADGSIPWVPGGRTDPWNHVESTMALVLHGRHEAAERAFAWVLDKQRPDGSWHAYYQLGEVVDDTLDSNVTAYIATGAWFHYLVTGDRDHLRRLWPSVERAMTFVLGLQKPSGAVRWARSGRGRATRKGLIAGSSSVHLSLRAAARAANALGRPAGLFDAAADRLARAIAGTPEDYLDKSRWAMDWYYPVLGGAIAGAAGRLRIRAGWDDFVVDGLGVRCVRHRPWVTAAETCELVIALGALGERERARELFSWAQHLRGDDAGYWMGANFNVGAFWPEEQPSWSSAAVVLAADALAGGPTAALFAHPG